MTIITIEAMNDTNISKEKTSCSFSLSFLPRYLPQMMALPPENKKAREPIKVAIGPYKPIADID